CINSWLDERDWQAACAEADRLDPGWRWDDLHARRPPVPVEQNATLRVLEIRRKLNGVWPNPNHPLDLNDIPPNLRLSADVAQLRRGLTEEDDALAAAKGLESLSGGYLQRNYQPPVLLNLGRNTRPDLMGMPGVANLLQTRALVLAEDGQLDDALKVVRQLLG